MNPLAAALLAAQGWDVSRLRKQGSGGESSSRQPNPQSQVDMHSLLNNPAIMQALQAQSSTSDEPPTPGQTTRFGRVSRPPAVIAEQESLAILQQIMAGDGNQGGSRQSVPPPRPNSRRPQSTLRESSIPRSRSPNIASATQSPPLQAEQPLVRPQHPAQGGRPRRGETLTKEERAERRRVQNTLSAADYRRKKEIYMSSLEDRIKDKETEIKAKAEECEMWRRKFADMEKQHAVMTALWTAAGFDLPNQDGTVQSNDRFMSNSHMPPPMASTSRPSGVRNIPDSRNASGISPAALNPIRSPIPLYSSNSTPNAYPSPALQSQNPTPLKSASTTLAAAMPAHPTVSPHNPFPESSPVGTADGDGTPFDLGVDLSAFDDFFNWDIQPDNDADDQQDADFIPASSPHRSDSEEETDREGDPSGPRKKRKTKNKGKGKRRDDDEEFIDPDVDEEDLFMPITDVAIPPGQMQLVEKATKDVMSTFGVDSQVQLTGVMQKIVDAGEGLTGEQLEKMKSVLRWMHMSGRLPK